MATVMKRERSPYWSAIWRDATGRQVWRSTKQTDRAAAMADALDYERADKMAGQGDMHEAQARKILNNILERAETGDTIRAPSIAEYLKGWMETKEANRAGATVERYQKVVDCFLESLKARASKPLTAICARDVEAFLNIRKGEGVSPKTLHLDCKIIRSAFNKARREGIITINPAEAVELPDMDSVQRGTFEAGEIQKLVVAAKGEWKTMILLGYFTGARLGDVAKMKWEGEKIDKNVREGVNFEAGTLTYWQQKNKKWVILPMHPELAEHLGNIAPDRAVKFIMPGMANKGPGGQHGLSEGFKRIVLAAGLSLDTVQGKGRRNISKRTFHALRHSFTSALANVGVAPEQRMKMTGHTSEQIHAGYTHIELQTLREAMAKMPGTKAVEPKKEGAK